MKHSMMRVAVAATLGLSALAASAGQIGVNVGSTLAAESITATVVVAQPTITYQTASLINDGAAVRVHVRFSAGDMTDAAAVLPASAKTFAGAVADVALFLNGAAVTATNYSVSASTADADGLGYYFTLTNLAGSGGFPANTVINILGTTAKLAVLSDALSAGGTVSTTVGYTTTAGDFAGVTTFVEPLVSATLLTSKKAVSQLTFNSNAVKATYFTVAEAQKVNVATSLTSFTGASPTAGTTLINLGVAKIKIDTTLINAVTGVAMATADLGTTVYSATGDFSVAGASAMLASDEACTTSVAAGTIAADGKSVKFAAEAAAVAVANSYLCYTIPGTKTVPYGVQYAISGAAIAAHATNSVASTQTGANVYLLNSNGASVVVPSFVPTTGALGAGYNTYLRIVNTGNLTSDINVAAYNPTTGVAGTPSKLASQLPAGGSVVLSTEAVSTALGLTTGTWYSLLVTGSTSQLAAQPLLVNPQGVITNIGAINGGNNAATAN